MFISYGDNDYTTGTSVVTFMMNVFKSMVIRSCQYSCDQSSKTHSNRNNKGGIRFRDICSLFYFSYNFFVIIIILIIMMIIIMMMIGNKN